jgi:hypothetical protein
VIINDCLILVVIVFFGLVIYSINRDEKRKSPRRQQQLPCSVERRHQERRKNSMASHLAWSIRNQWSKLIK